MHISPQLATADRNQASSAATSLPAASVPTFHQAFRDAATRSETAGQATGNSLVSSDKSTASDDARTAGGTDAESSAVPVGGQSVAPALPAVDLKPSGQAFVTATYDFSGRTELLAEAGKTTIGAAPALSPQTPAVNTRDSKSKKTSPVEGSAEAVTLPADPPASTPGAPASTPDAPLLAVMNPTPLPLSAPVNEASASTETLADNAGSSALVGDLANPVSSAPASLQTVGADAPAEGQSPAMPTPAASTAVFPATASGDLVANAGLLAAATIPKAPTSRPGAIPASDSKPAAGTTVSSKASVSSASNGVEPLPAPLATLGSVQTATPLQDASPVAPTSAAGTDRSIAEADRSSAGEVRGKRKDSTADASAPERDSTTTAPAPFAAKLAEAQPPAPAGAYVAALPKAPDVSQPLTASISPAPAQTNLPSTAAASAAPAPPSIPAGSAEVSADPAVLPGASSAQLIQSAGQTEMRLGMRSAEFGNISISTSVSHQAISAQISLDHTELGRALAVHLPAIEEKLGSAYGLHARVEVRDESAASRPATDSGQQGGASQGQSGGARGGQSRSGSAVSLMDEVNTGNVGPTTLAGISPSSAAPAESSRLDIRI